MEGCKERDKLLNSNLVPTTCQKHEQLGTGTIGDILNSNHNILPLTPKAHDYLICPFSPYHSVHKILIVPRFFKSPTSETPAILKIILGMNPYQYRIKLYILAVWARLAQIPP